MIPWRLRAKVGLKGTLAVIKRPLYLLITVVLSVFTLGAFVWAYNLDLLRYVLLESNIDVIGKVTFIFNGYESIFTNFSNGIGLIIALFALLSAINTALFVFLIRSKVKLVGKGRGIGATVLAVIGAGCAACGTSILAPLLAAGGSVASIGLTETIGITANILGIILMTYSIIGLGGQAATAIAQENNR